jgi:hypothetical protein
MRSVTWVVVEDVKSGSWGIGRQRRRPRTCEHWPRRDGSLIGISAGGQSQIEHLAEEVSRC